MIDSERIPVAAGTILSEDDRLAEADPPAEVIELVLDECAEVSAEPPPLLPSRRRTVPILRW